MNCLHRVMTGGAVRRRSILAAGAVGMVASVGRPINAFGRNTEIVVADWGGDSDTAFRASWTDILARDGFRLVTDTSGPAPGRIRAMADSGKIIWDVCDTSAGGTFQLGDAGMLEEIDYSIVDRNKVRPEFAFKYSVCNYMYSYVMAVNTSKFAGNALPKTWVDFYDVQKFPGRRMLRALVEGQLEGALLADGVSPHDLYPLDVDRALAKIRSIKSQLLFWNTGAESENLIRQGEVVMGNMWNGRAYTLHQESDGKATWSWEGAVLAPAVWAVPKGNPAGKQAAMRCIAAMQDPAGQASYFIHNDSYPANPAASSLIPADRRAFDGSQPDNAARQIPFNVGWYAKHSVEVQAKYLQMISA